MSEVARPHLFKKRNRIPHLAAEQNIPKQHRGNEHTTGFGHPGGIGQQMLCDEAPKDKLEHWPVYELQHPRPRPNEKVHIA